MTRETWAADARVPNISSTRASVDQRQPNISRMTEMCRDACEFSAKFVSLEYVRLFMKSKAFHSVKRIRP
jgi:hypothetical protein